MNPSFLTTFMHGTNVSDLHALDLPPCGVGIKYCTPDDNELDGANLVEVGLL